MAKVLISMPDDFLNKIDNFASAEQRTRSELIREALRNYLRKSFSINRELVEKNAKVLEDLLE
ncbi:MAG: ribbon-helix-helix domain-containing protein [Candidatus Gastranaerophilales bacterium]|nr:ribbon-helix-helix domain-containing protein [Candidatus Gastranaerophilales bacterium]